MKNNLEAKHAYRKISDEKINLEVIVRLCFMYILQNPMIIDYLKDGKSYQKMIGII
ncbi:hypothetical protein SUT380_17520 [Streptococcus parasuis]|nr:hypothetical protein SUT380_17520 [Streptococcus parasuis]